jgi:Tfp pilus assembly protein PilF
MNSRIPLITAGVFALFWFEPVGVNCAGLGLAGSQTTAASPADVALSEGMNELQRGNMALARAAFEKAVKLAHGNAAAHDM